MSEKNSILPSHARPWLRVTRGITMSVVVLSISALIFYAVFEQYLPTAPDTEHAFAYQINVKDRMHYVTADQKLWLGLAEAAVEGMVVAVVIVGGMAEWLARNGPRRSR